jgi:hypothetical protein
MEDRDTIPAPPVLSNNPIAREREEAVIAMSNLKYDLRAASVAIVEIDKWRWRGLTIKNGVANFYTMELSEEEARQWLKAAVPAARRGAWVPTVCPRCAKPRTSPSMCEACLKASRK